MSLFNFFAVNQAVDPKLGHEKQGHEMVTSLNMFDLLELVVAGVDQFLRSCQQ